MGSLINKPILQERGLPENITRKGCTSTAYDVPGTTIQPLFSATAYAVVIATQWYAA